MNATSRIVQRRWIPAAVAVVWVAAAAVATLAGVSEPSVARIWNEQLLAAIRKDVPKPPVHARNLFHVSVAMWDAWAAYDTRATGYLVKEKHTATDVAAARAEAISFAAYRVLQHRYPPIPLDAQGKPCHPGGAASQASFDATMDALGYDRSFTSTVGDSPAALGNRIGQAIIQYGLTDGANEGLDVCFPDDTGYFPSNPDLVFKLPGSEMFAPNNWQALAFDYQVLQNGIIVGKSVQRFVGVGWGDVKPFALSPADLPDDPDPPTDCLTTFGVPQPYLDPGCPPQLAGTGDETLKDAIREVIFFEAGLDPGDGVDLDISPGAPGCNNPLGADTGTGHPLNPSTGQPYPRNVVKRADAWRVIAEFWADGPKSETPPGHWNVLANELADHPTLTKRIGGTGPIVSDLEWDVKVYLALNGAVHDAAIGAWSAKHYYDSSRPISLIRYMGGLGQSSDPSGPSGPSYHPDGLPLEPGLIEVITAETAAPGGRHEALANFCELGENWGKPCHVDLDCADSFGTGICVSSIGQIAVRAWNGSPPDPQTQLGGVSWRRASNWMPFQAATFVTPPFPGYTSGHSTYSRSAAEVLTAFTANPFFPGGLGTFVAQQNEYLAFEEGPTETVELQWATYYDAADQAGISRRLGGIHPYYDDFPARVMGSAIGKKAVARAFRYFGRRLKLQVPVVPGGRPGFAVVPPRASRTLRVSPPQQ